AAKAAKQPVPKGRSIKKKAWLEVVGEERRSQTDLAVTLPWSVGLRDLRDQRMVSATGGRVGARAMATRGEVSGDARACAGGAGHLKGKLPSGDHLARQAADKIGAKIVKWALSQVD
ncbi:MAG: hypothetical protein VX938_03090, partial [Myxococcota bacterium]|nr:hypothetical protein [Myxococcota bacterium]